MPYANGEIHIGHILEHIQTDIWTRFMRNSNHEVLSFCADDAHGAPIMMKADEMQIKPIDFIDQMKKDHMNSLEKFGISISNSLLEKNPSFENRYLEGVDMVLFLLIYIEQITQFCKLFSEEFQQIFMQTPTTFFAAAESDWVDIIDNA